MENNIIGEEGADINNPGIMSENLPFKRVYYKTMQPGSLISCQYSYWKHDPYPLVLITDIGSGPSIGLANGMAGIRGINLHYLTYRYISDVLSKYCDQTGFSYNYIKSDRFIVNAFRTYKRPGLKWIKQLDCEYIQQAMKVARSFRPDQIKQIRKAIEDQLSQQKNPKANELVDQYQNMFAPGQQSGFQQLQQGQRPHGRQAPTIQPIQTVQPVQQQQPPM